MEEHDWKLMYANLMQFLAATIWHLNNIDEHGIPTTHMSIPAQVYVVVGKKLAQIPKDRVFTEEEALELARKK